jgi:hypothetical protein
MDAIDTLHASAHTEPRLLRLWSAADDQLVAALWGDRCALYVVESADGYATSVGDQSLHESFEVLDHEGHTLTVPFADCVSWDYARRALVRFIGYSDLGDIPVEGRIPSLLLMMGDVDRRAALEVRANVPRELARSSLPNMAGAQPQAALAHDFVDLAHRVLEEFRARGLFEVRTPTDLPWMANQLARMLSAYADDAQRSLSTAEWIVGELATVHGIVRWQVRGSDLRSALQLLRR